jgi:hypothetical protein
VLIDDGYLSWIACFRGTQLPGEGEAPPAERVELIEDSVGTAWMEQAATRECLADEQQVHVTQITGR